MWVARNPPGFAFVWFADDRDATDAVREVDGRSINGREWRVEIVSTRSFALLTCVILFFELLFGPLSALKVKSYFSIYR